MNHQKRFAIFAAILAAAFAGTVFVSNGQLSSLHVKEQQNDATISELKAEISERQKNAEWEAPPVLSSEDQEKVSHSAAELGDQIANYQNAYAGLDASSKDFDANVEALDAFFTEDAKNARTPWYNHAGTPGTWTFVTDGAFEGIEKQVLWLCQDPQTGKLLAYTTAKFHSETNLFDEVSCKMTLEAMHSVKSSGDQSKNSNIDTGAVNQMAEDIKNANVSSERELTDEETEDVKDAQQKLRDKMSGN